MSDRLEIVIVRMHGLALLSTVLTAPQMARLSIELVGAAESFAPSGAEPIKLAINDVEERENLPKTDWKELKIHVNMSGPYGVPHFTFLFEDDGHEVS